MAAPGVKHLEQCSPENLVKMNIERKARFALLGKPGNAFIPAYVLFENRCELVNLADGFGGFTGEYDGAFAVDFGSDFILKPSYSDCEIGRGDLFNTPGAIIRTVDADYLVGFASGARGPIYRDMKTGSRIGEPGGPRVAFAAWSLFTPEDDKVPIIEMNVRKAGSPATS